MDHADLHELAVEILGRDHGFVFRAHGRSMWPFIRDGDTVHVVPVVPEQLRRGDIVLFRTIGEALLAHRIVRLLRSTNGFTWVTRGDALLATDAPFAAHQLLGRVSRRIRQGRSVRLDGGWRRWAGLLWIYTVRPRAIIRRLLALLTLTR
ncbi:MAG: S24/S26 family peptidase [Kiritimatiellaeota bacterium]|nr:S24/S26 family peptidase [Kiritimatiellota bacterium]